MAKTRATLALMLSLATAILTTPITASALPYLLSCNQSGVYVSCDFPGIPQINQYQQYDPSNRQAQLCTPTAWSSIIAMLYGRGYQFGGFNPYLSNATYRSMYLANFMGTTASGGTQDFGTFSENQTMSGIAANFSGGASLASFGFLGTTRVSPQALAAIVSQNGLGVMHVGFYTPIAIPALYGKLAAYVRTGGHSAAITGVTTNLTLAAQGSPEAYTFRIMDPLQTIHAVWFAPTSWIPQAASSVIATTISGQTINEGGSYAMYAGNFQSSASNINILEGFMYLH